MKVSTSPTPAIEASCTPPIYGLVVLEVKLQGFVKIRHCFLFGCSVAGYLNVQAACNESIIFREDHILHFVFLAAQ
jgi:hypothetical protein